MHKKHEKIQHQSMIKKKKKLKKVSTEGMPQHNKSRIW